MFLGFVPLSLVAPVHRRGVLATIVVATKNSPYYFIRFKLHSSYNLVIIRVSQKQSHVLILLVFVPHTLRLVCTNFLNTILFSAALLLSVYLSISIYLSMSKPVRIEPFHCPVPRLARYPPRIIALRVAPPRSSVPFPLSGGELKKIFEEDNYP